MNAKNEKLMDFGDKVMDALLVYNPSEFIKAVNGRDLILIPERAQDFLREALEKMEDLYEESKSL